MDVATCICGAMGRMVAPDFGYGGSKRQPLMQWTGGRIGGERIAVEVVRHGVTRCPACQHRACVFELVGAGQR